MARIAMTLGFVQPASSRCSIREWPELFGRCLSVGGKVHQNYIPLMGPVTGNRHIVLSLLRDGRRLSKMTVFPFNTDHPRTQQQGDSQKSICQPLPERALSKNRPYRSH